MIGIFGSLIPLIVLGAIVYAIVGAARRRGEDAGRQSDGSSIRRLFVYGMTYVALVVAGIGLTGLFGRIFTSAAARRDSELAEPLALAVVGLPVFLALARWLWRTHLAEPVERTTLSWALYVNGALLLGVAVAVGFAFALANNLIEGSNAGEEIAGVLVWSAIWAAHWTAWRRIPPTLMPRAHLWLASAGGLWITAGSIGFLINEAVQRVFDTATAGATVTSSDEIRMAVAGAVIGAAVWSWHWLANGVRIARDVGWHAYVLIAGVLTGLVTAITGAAFVLYLVLEWLLGDPGAVTASAHFADGSAAIAAAIVGSGVWWYHRTVIGPRTSRVRTEIDRVYDYLVAAVSLATVATAIGILVLALFSVVTPADAATDGGGSINTLLGAVTALVVGAPMWSITWRRIQSYAQADAGEISSPSRRVYLLAIFGVGGAIAFGALIALLVVVFEALFGEGAGRAIAGEVDVPIALLVTTGIAAWYHWLVYRAERETVAHVARRDVLLVTSNGIDIDDIALRTNTRIRVLHAVDGDPSPGVGLDAIVSAIAAVEGEHLLVLTRGDVVEVIPYT